MKRAGMVVGLSLVLLLGISILALSAGRAPSASAWDRPVGSYSLDWRSVDGGGGVSQGGGYTLAGTAGQADGGLVAGGAYTLGGGFWGGGALVGPAYHVYLPLVLRNGP